MKIGIHLSMWSDSWDQDLSIHLNRIREIGYDGVEMSLYGISFDRVADLRRKLEDSGLLLTCSTGIGPETDISSPDVRIRERGEAYLKRAVDTVTSLRGQLLCGVLYAPWQKFRPEEPRLERWKRSAEVLHRVGEYAGERGLELAVEPLNRFETDFVNTLEEGAKFVKLIEQPNVRLLADTFHQNIEEKDPIEAIVQTISHIGHFHCSENHRGVPGSGHIDWKKIVATLHQAGYGGWLTIESFLTAGTEVGRELKVWRNLAVDRMQAAEAGFRYLRSYVEEAKT